MLYFNQNIFHTAALIMFRRFTLPLYPLLWELIKHYILLHEIHFYIMANKHIYSITLKKCSSFHTRVLYATSSTWHLHSSAVDTQSGFGPSHFNPTSLSTGSSHRGGWPGHNVFEMLVSVLKACWDVTRLDKHI